MKSTRIHSLTRTLALAALLGTCRMGAAAIIAVDGSSPDDVPGISTFKTHGDDMDGLLVTATFLSGFTETVAMNASGVDTGKATGSFWDLTASGDTFFANAWTWNQTGSDWLVSLELDGTPGLTVFDRFIDPPFLTPNTANGRDFETSLAADAFITATYSNPVGVDGAAPLDDIYHLLSVNFIGQTPNGELLTTRGEETFTFSQDTDSDVRRFVPEPGSLLMMGAGLALFGVGRRARS